MGIIASIMYAVDPYTLSFAQPDDTVQRLKSSDFRNVEEGLALVTALNEADNYEGLNTNVIRVIPISG